MQSRQGIKRWLTEGCIYYTLISFILILIQFILNGDESAGRINTFSFFLLLPTGLSLSAAGMVLRLEKMSALLRYLSHYGITMLTLYLFMFLPSNAEVRASTALILFVLVSILYWICLGIVLGLRRRVKKLMQED